MAMKPKPAPKPAPKRAANNTDPELPRLYHVHAALQAMLPELAEQIVTHTHRDDPGVRNRTAATIVYQMLQVPVLRLQHTHELAAVLRQRTFFYNAAQPAADVDTPCQDLADHLYSILQHKLDTLAVPKVPQKYACDSVRRTRSRLAGDLISELEDLMLEYQAQVSRGRRMRAEASTQHADKPTTARQEDSMGYDPILYAHVKFMVEIVLGNELVRDVLASFIKRANRPGPQDPLAAPDMGALYQDAVRVCCAILSTK